MFLSYKYKQKKCFRLQKREQGHLYSRQLDRKTTSQQNRLTQEEDWTNNSAKNFCKSRVTISQFYQEDFAFLQSVQSFYVSVQKRSNL
jgi:hypothetical protein